jgi:hypothetical protein
MNLAKRVNLFKGKTFISYKRVLENTISEK